MQASDVMSRNVASVTEDASIAEAVRLMLSKGISGLPVLDAAGRLVGVVTEGDLLRRAELGTERQRPNWVEFLRGPGRQASDYVRTHAHRVADVMTLEPVAVDEGTLLEKVVGLMERRRIKRVLVTRNGRLAGLVSRADLLRVLLADMDAQAVEPACRSDDEMRERLLQTLGKQNWAPRESLHVSCDAGVVTLEGVILDERERDALRVAAEAIPGVTRVEDRLYWIDTTTGISLEPGGAVLVPR